MVHSTRGIAEQLSFSLDVAITLQNLYSEMENRECEQLIILIYQGNCHVQLKGFHKGMLLVQSNQDS